MRRVILLLTALATTNVVASEVALAVNKVGTNGPDTLRGTNRADNLLGEGGSPVNSRDRTRWYLLVLYGQKSAYPGGFSAYLGASEYA